MPRLWHCLGRDRGFALGAWSIEQLTSRLRPPCNRITETNCGPLGPAPSTLIRFSLKPSVLSQHDGR